MISMKLKMATALTVLMSSSLGQFANADSIQLGTPAYGGTGCPAGTASMTLSPDNTALSILFDQFVVEAGGATGRRVDRKSCNLAIPVHVPQGYSISFFRIDYRGFNLVPQGGRVQLNAEYFFAGSRGPRTTRTFAGPVNDNYIYTNSLLAEAVVWSGCGADVNLRVNADLMVQTDPRLNQAMSTVDSADVESGLVYHIRWRRCN